MICCVKCSALQPESQGGKATYVLRCFRSAFRSTLLTTGVQLSVRPRFNDLYLEIDQVKRFEPATPYSINPTFIQSWVSMNLSMET